MIQASSFNPLAAELPEKLDFQKPESWTLGYKVRTILNHVRTPEAGHIHAEWFISLHHGWWSRGRDHFDLANGRHG